MQKRLARLLALSIGLAITAGVIVLGVYTGRRTQKPPPMEEPPPIEAPDAVSLPITQQLAAQEADLLETVFRYQIQRNRSGLDLPATESVYISLDDHKDRRDREA